MKHLSLIAAVACALTFAGNSALRADSAATPNYTFAFRWPWASNSLDSEINNLNRMRGQVRWQFRNYKSNETLRADDFKISRAIDDINTRFKQAKFDKRQLRKDVDRAHAELHRIELAMKVKPRDFYAWK